MLVFTVREPGSFYRWRTAFVIDVCVTNTIHLSATPLVSYPTVSPVCKQFLSCMLREPRISPLIIFQVLGPLWTLASSTVFLHSRRSLTIVGQFLFPVIFTFSCILSFRILCGRAFLHVPLWLLQFVLAFVVLHSFNMTLPS